MCESKCIVCVFECGSKCIVCVVDFILFVFIVCTQCLCWSVFCVYLSCESKYIVCVSECILCVFCV